MLHRGKSQLPNFSADLLSVPPVWPLFRFGRDVQQLKISPAKQTIVKGESICDSVAIFLLQNPYNALVAEWNREKL